MIPDSSPATIKIKLTLKLFWNWHENPSPIDIDFLTDFGSSPVPDEIATCHENEARYRHHLKPAEQA